MTIDIRSVPHREIAVDRIHPNPYRDLKRNPIKQDRVEELIGSFERTGFWDNIVVREHPQSAGNFQLAYGHNRLATLNDKRVRATAINIPVAPLTDWEMYCAMVDENELQGAMTPAIVFENINVGCDMIEQALEKIGPKGTFLEFQTAIGRSVSTDTERKLNDHGFEMVRSAWFRGEGLGRGFLIEFLPCGNMRSNNISEVLNTRYAAKRAAAKEAEAEAKRKAAAEAQAAAAEQARAAAAERKTAEDRARQARRDAEKAESDRRKAEDDSRRAKDRDDKARERKAREEAKKAEEEAKRAEREKAAAERDRLKAEEDAKKAAEAQAKAEAEAKKATQLSAEAKRIGAGAVAESILLMFDSPNRMTMFAQAIRHLNIPETRHRDAAKHVLDQELHEKRIETGLSIWWDQISGESEKRRKAAAERAKFEKFLKQSKGVDFNSFLAKTVEIAEELQDRIKKAMPYANLADEHGLRLISKLEAVANSIDDLIERSRAALSETKDITPETQMLTHRS